MLAQLADAIVVHDGGFTIGSLVQLLVLVIVFGLIVWAVTRLPIAEPFRTIVWVVCVLIFILVLLHFVGLY
jgi:multisubunit Na+/H+ antiporter MnhB subunit